MWLVPAPLLLFLIGWLVQCEPLETIRTTGRASTCPQDVADSAGPPKDRWSRDGAASCPVDVVFDESSSPHQDNKDSCKRTLSKPCCCTLQAQLTGPKMVRGQEQGSLTVQCRYDSVFKTYRMYWCRGADWSSCKILVKTDATEKLVKRDRVSIRDNQTDFTLTVTMEDLRRSDAGIYWCAIERAGYDYGFEVSVTIEPAPGKSTILITTATGLTSVKSTIETNRDQRVTQTTPLTRSPLSSIYFRLLVFLELPLLLSMLSAILWVNRPQRWSGGR